MFASKVMFLLALGASMSLTTATPDSAGLVEMEDGLAYGGIPYGSVTGMVAKYPGFRADQARGLSLVNRPVIITPNFRASRVVNSGAGPRPVQIYNLPGVVAPGVVGRISQIGY